MPWWDAIPRAQKAVCTVFDFFNFVLTFFLQYVKVNIDILLADSKILETLKKNWAVIIINYYELFSVFYFAMRVKLQKLNIL